MSALPPALRPWATQLSLFPEDLALHLGPYVARLSAALGSLRPRGEAEGGEPQGYDGLTRRGTYDRLLVSEWLWALESPDELVRRAAFGELSFLKPAFRQPQGARRTVALLDVGPDQLGAPRIAHLALLIVLSRRAEAAGAAFSWAMLQADPSRGAFSEVTAGTLGTWLAERDLTPPTDERLAAWRDALSLDAGPEDAWLVGSPRLSRLPKASGLSRVEVAEVLAPGARQLTVEVRPASRAARSVVLDLPPPDTSVRLLRNPLQQPRPAPPGVHPASRVAPLRTFSFSADGKRLMLFWEDGSVGAMAIPHSVRATVPRPRRVTPPAGQVLLGAGWRHNGGLIALTRRGDEYVLHGKLRGSWHDNPGKEAFLFDKNPVHVSPPANGVPGRLLSCEDSNGNERLLLAGLDDKLYLIDEDRAARRIDIFLLEQRITAVAEVNRKVVFVTGKPAVPGIQEPEGWLSVVEKDHVRDLRLGAEASDAYFGFMNGAGHPDAGLFAVRHEPGSWRLFRSDTAEAVDFSTDMSVFGVGTCREAPGGPGLLVLEEDRRTFSLISPTVRYPFTSAWGTGVAHVEASHALPVFGWMMRSGVLVLHDLRDGSILYQALPGAL